MHSCKVQNKNCNLQYVDPSKNFFKIKGCLNQASLEDGSWEVYDTTNSLIEQGNYDNGLRKGKWFYPQSNNLSLTWRKYSYDKIGLVTNILSGFTVVDSDSDYVKLSNKDSGNLINIVIAVHNLSSTKIDPDEYYKQGESEILQRGLQYQQNRTELIFINRKAYFNEYKITDSSRVKEFYLSNIYSVLTNEKLVEITCSYTEKGGLIARKMFFAVMTNCFIHGKRFFDPFEQLVNIIEVKR